MLVSDYKHVCTLAVADYMNSYEAYETDLNEVIQIVSNREVPKELESAFAAFEAYLEDKFDPSDANSVDVCLFELYNIIPDLNEDFDSCMAYAVNGPDQE